MDLKNFSNFVRDLEAFETFTKYVGIKCVPQSPVPMKSISTFMHHRKRFNPIEDLTDGQFEGKYRFSKESMCRIIEIVRDDLEGDHSPIRNSNQVSVDLQIMAAIRHWGYSEDIEATAKAHGISVRTLLKICRRVSAVLASKASRYIRMPVTLAEKERVTNAFQTLACMPQVIGAVSHTFVRFQRHTFGTHPRDAFDSTDGFIVIQIVSDTSYKVRDVDCKFRRLNHESDIFGQTKIKERFEQNEFHGRILIGREIMSYSSFVLKPISFPLTLKDHLFNQSHAQTLTPVTKCFQFLKQRFNILNNEIYASYNVARNTIVALTLLHNLALEWEDIAMNNF